jgi:hypothetical protein
LNDDLSWLFTNRLSATRYMKVKRMGITEILRRICLFSANKIKSSESFSKQPTQLIVELIAADNWHKGFLSIISLFSSFVFSTWFFISLFTKWFKQSRWPYLISFKEWNILLSLFCYDKMLLATIKRLCLKLRLMVFKEELFCACMPTSCKN